MLEKDAPYSTQYAEVKVASTCRISIFKTKFAESMKAHNAAGYKETGSEVQAGKK